MALGMFNKIPIYPIFYLLKGDYKGLGCRRFLLVQTLGVPVGCTQEGQLHPKSFSGVQKLVRDAARDAHSTSLDVLLNPTPNSLGVIFEV